MPFNRVLTRSQLQRPRNGKTLSVNPDHVSNISHKTVAFLIDPAFVWEDSHNFNIGNNDNAYHQLSIYHTADSGLGTIHVLLHFFILTELQTRVLKPCLRWKKNQVSVKSNNSFMTIHYKVSIRFGSQTGLFDSQEILLLWFI